MKFRFLLLILFACSMNSVIKGMNNEQCQKVVPVYVTNNCPTYAVTLLKSSHHGAGCYYATTVYAGHPFPPNDYTAHGLSINRPFKVITQKGPFVLALMTIDNTPILSIYREGLVEPEIVGEESMQNGSWFKVEVTVDENGSLSYLKKPCDYGEVINSEYYGKKMPTKNYGF